jgi:hypothetical protein
MSPDPQDMDQQFLRFMCRHLVVLCTEYHTLVNGKPQGQEHRTALSGFVIEIEGRWCFATAGHILQDEDELGDAIRNGRTRPRGKADAVAYSAG